jgi:hypothetical protein
MNTIDNLIICEHIGLFTPTIVYYKGERLETVGLDIETLTKTWRDKWIDLKWEWIVLAFTQEDYNAIQRKTLLATRSVREILYENKVICINQEPISERAIKEWSEKCEADQERFINELEGF